MAKRRTRKKAAKAAALSKKMPTGLARKIAGLGRKRKRR
jgi:hypothetical protein